MNIRTKRIGSNFVKEISYILMTEVKDPKTKFITITDCDVTNDLSYAKVYFTVLDREKKDEAQEALNKAANFIELELSKRIDIRKMPQISFHYDNSSIYGEMMDKKFEELNKKENEK